MTNRVLALAAAAACPAAALAQLDWQQVPTPPDGRPFTLRTATTCRSDFDGDLTIFDFLVFQNAFDAGCA